MSRGTPGSVRPEPDEPTVREGRHRRRNGMTLRPIATGTRAAAVASLLAAISMPAAAGPDFAAEVRPILQKCLPCHGPDAHSRMANLRLDSREAATGAEGGYAGIVPGDSTASRVMARVTADSSPMPPTGERLSEREIETLAAWIDAGAAYESHWAFNPPVASGPPEVSDPGWTRNPIDGFVLSRLDSEGLRPSREADRDTLVRRLALDLTGLPPTPEEADAFAADTSPEAYANLVDRLLNSSAYGERWARVWLDLARYADSMGYEKDSLRTIWPYRDWVVKALNENMPFDEFTVRQLAGDLLPDPSTDDLVATGFHRNTMTNTEGGTDDEEFRDAAVKDRVATTGQTWMGLTWGCAQCHSHKYDPVSHAEFYSLYAFFNQTADADRNDDSPTLEVSEDVSTPVLSELSGTERRETFVHRSGNFMNRGERVEPGVPAAFHPLPPEAPRNRLGLARWLVAEENPLTARVAVNRIWARLFGAGIVATEEDFGTQGTQPTHPQLLDWLATEFMRSGWDVKGLIRTVVASATYRQTSDATAAALAADPENTLLARGPRFRLPAETVRDQALAASGLLSRKIGGPPVMPWQPAGIWQVVYSNRQWETSPGPDRHRRALYTLWRRTSPYPAMTTFDAPSGETCTVRRIRTNTPLQALVTLNDPTLMEAAQHLAGRAMAEAGPDDEAILDRLFRLVLTRPPSAAERERLLALREEAARDLEADPASAAKLASYDQVLYTSLRRRTLLADTRTEAPVWRYTSEEPGADWTLSGFDDSAWSVGRGAFGISRAAPESKDPYEASIRTAWDTTDLWMRITFDIHEPGLDGPRFEVRHSGAFEAYVNGIPAAGDLDGSGVHSPYAMSRAAAASLRRAGNVLAVRAIHTGLTDAARNIDLGVTALSPPEFRLTGSAAAAKASWAVVANVVLNLDEALTKS